MKKFTVRMENPTIIFRLSTQELGWAEQSRKEQSKSGRCTPKSRERKKNF